MSIHPLGQREGPVVEALLRLTPADCNHSEYDSRIDLEVRGNAHPAGSWGSFDRPHDIADPLSPRLRLFLGPMQARICNFGRKGISE